MTSEIPASVNQFVDSTITGSKVAGFSKSYCPFCHKAYDAITSFKLKDGALNWLQIENREDCAHIQDYLKQLTGARSVPRVFINGKFLGGGDETVKAKNDGTLEKLLTEAGAI
jgi:glutaredoxin 3